jgi:hypothetical protein
MDRVRFESQERADLDDVDGLQDLGYEYDQRTLGGLLGFQGSEDQDYTGGVLMSPVLDNSVPAAVTIGPALFLTLEQTATKRPVAAVVQSAAGTVDVGLEPATPWLWFRRQETASDAATRRKWDGGEVAYSPTTRYREECQFTASVLRPTVAPGDEKWYPWAKVTGWVGGLPTIVQLSAWDEFRTSWTPGANVWSVSAPGGLTTSTYSLRQLLLTMRIAFLRIIDTTMATNWETSLTVPPRGLVQIDAALTALEAITAPAARLAAKASGHFYVTGSTVVLSPGVQDENVQATGTWIATGKYRVNLITSIPRTSWLERIVVMPGDDTDHALMFRGDPVYVGDNCTAIDVRIMDVVTGAYAIPPSTNFSVLAF